MDAGKPHREDGDGSLTPRPLDALGPLGDGSVGSATSQSPSRPGPPEESKLMWTLCKRSQDFCRNCRWMSLLYLNFLLGREASWEFGPQPKRERSTPSTGPSSDLRES